MDTETKIIVNNDLDIVMVRMLARDIAKKMGFGAADQARISLAASEMARVLSWTTHESGCMVISNVTRNGSQCLQVACLVQQEYIAEGNGTSEKTIPQRSFVGACRLVDESSVEWQDDYHARVTLIKWLK